MTIATGSNSRSGTFPFGSMTLKDRMKRRSPRSFLSGMLCSVRHLPLASSLQHISPDRSLVLGNKGSSSALRPKTMFLGLAGNGNGTCQGFCLVVERTNTETILEGSALLNLQNLRTAPSVDRSYAAQTPLRTNQQSRSRTSMPLLDCSYSPLFPRPFSGTRTTMTVSVGFQVEHMTLKPISGNSFGSAAEESQSSPAVSVP